MSGRYDVDDHLADGAGPDVRQMLETASWGRERSAEAPVDVDGFWAAGRRRRTRKRVGAAALVTVVLTSVGGLVWSSGLMGGERGERDHVATVPAGWTTFVFTAPDAAGIDPSANGAISVPTVEELSGTTWTLREDLWEEDAPASGVIGTGLPTTLSFQPTHWGVLTDRCGAFAFEDLTIAADGTFEALRPFTADQGCAPEALAAEDFWQESLSAGGILRELDGGRWLLLSVNPQVPSDLVGESAPVVTTDVAVGTGAPTASAKPSATDVPGESSAPGSSAPPTAPPTVPPSEAPSEAPASPAPSSEPPSEPSAEPPGPSAEPPSASSPSPAPDAGPAFRDPTQAWVDGPSTAAGGQLFAPTVRTGVHDGFDRIVVDLTGPADASRPGWRAAYTDAPTRDASGLPMEIAGDSVLELVLNGMAYPEPDDPVYDAGDFGLDTHRLGAVVEVIRTTPFEGQVQVFVGMNGDPRPYRVFVLEGPMRLVIDVQN